MYTYVSALTKQLSEDEQWSSTTDISNIPLDTLFSIYSRVIVILSNPFLPGNVAVDLNTLQTIIGGLSITLKQYLIQNANKTIPALPSIPTLNPKFVKYSDGFKAGYKITPCNPNSSVTSNLPAGDKPWLYLTKPNLDYNLFYKSCLVNVNGFFHLTDTDGSGVFVVDGMKSTYKSNNNKLGICNFSDIGNIELIPITSSMIYKQNSNQLYKNEVFINSGVDTTGKTILLILGGYMHVLDNTTFIPINNTTIKIDFSNLPLLDRYFESKDYIDLSSLGLSTTAKNDNQVAISELYSDNVLVAYLTLSQSFIVLLDNTNISVDRLPIHTGKLPDMYVSNISPDYPLVKVSTGKLINFWSVYEDSKYSITTTNTLDDNYIYNTVDVMSQNSVDDARVIEQPQSLPILSFLKISSVNI